jgi:hypothetical protein
VDNELIENLLLVINPFVMGAIEEITPFDEKTEAERNEIMQVALKSLEIATVITSKFTTSDSIDKDKLQSAVQAITDKNFERAAEMLK